MAEKIFIPGTNLLKRGKKDYLESLQDFIPLNGEPIYEIDTKRLKIGNGELAYINLPYIGGNHWYEEQISELTTRVEGAEETINAFLREAEVGAEAVDTLKEIQASLDAGEVSAANLLNKVSELETVHEDYVKEHQNIRASLTEIAENTNQKIEKIKEDYAKADQVLLEDTKLSATIATETSERKTADDSLRDELKLYFDTQLGVIENGSY